MNLADDPVTEGEGCELDYDKYGCQSNSFYKDADEWWANLCKLGEKEFEESGIQKDLVNELNGDGGKSFCWRELQGLVR